MKMELVLDNPDPHGGFGPDLKSPGDTTALSAEVGSDQTLDRTSVTSDRGSSRGLAKICIQVLAWVILMVLYVCGFIHSRDLFNGLMPFSKNNICTTAECINTAALILNSMDPTADPCDNFYQFACGNFNKEHPIPDNGLRECWLDNRQRSIERTVREYLERNNTDEEPKSVHQARIMFRACKDIDTLEKLSLSPMMTFLERIGLPRTPPLEASAPLPLAWQEAIARVKRYMNKDIFFRFEVTVDHVNNTVKRLSVDIPEYSSSLYSHHEHSRIKPSPVRMLLDEEGSIIWVAWEEYIVKTMKYILQYNNQSSTVLDSTVQEAAKRIIEFDIKLSILKKNFTSKAFTKGDPPTNLWVSELQKITDKAVNSSSTSQINWRRYIEILFKGIDEVGIDLDKNDTLAVYNLEYLTALMKLLEETPSSTIFLTVWYRVVIELAPHTTKYMRDLITDFQKALGEVAPVSRPTYCTEVVYKLLSVAVGTMAARESQKASLYSNKPKVNKMIDNIQDSLMEAVDKTSWLDKKTKAAVKEKVGYIKREIGFPEELLDSKAVDDYYYALEISEKTHLENVLACLSHSVNTSFSNLHTYNSNNNTVFDPLKVNAFYDVQDNAIIVPLGIIQFPFYHLGIDALNYGAIGSILGHELVHSLDTTGRRYDKFGNHRSWWTNESISAFNQKASCLVDKYSSYYIKDINRWVDGNLTLGENIADNGGLRAALAGYHRRVTREGAEPKLPGLQEYNHDQLFYLAFANIWCENWSHESMRHLLKDEHAPNYVRIMGTLSNTPEFGNTWKCRTDSVMNPSHKCQLW